MIKTIDLMIKMIQRIVKVIKNEKYDKGDKDDKKRIGWVGWCVVGWSGGQGADTVLGGGGGVSEAVGREEAMTFLAWLRSYKVEGTFASERWALKKHREQHYVAVLYNSFPRDSFFLLAMASDERATQRREPAGASQRLANRPGAQILR